MCVSVCVCECVCVCVRACVRACVCVCVTCKTLKVFLLNVKLSHVKIMLRVTTKFCTCMGCVSADQV